jgi:Histone-like transcription factor (CBF/NF-Y) and archaeal histone
MKSEDFAMQELEKNRRIQSGEPLEGEGARHLPRFMIAAEAPIVMTKACELLIKELSIRAWRHTDLSRRKTVQRTDVHAAVHESEIFDFLIDIVPRVPHHHNVGEGGSLPTTNNNIDPSGVTAAQAASLQQYHFAPPQQAPPPHHQPETINPMMPGADFSSLQAQMFFPVHDPTAAGNTAGGVNSVNASDQQPEQPSQPQQQQESFSAGHLWGGESADDVVDP